MAARAGVFRSDTHKECTRCHKIKPRSLFDAGRRKEGCDPNHTQCKDCRSDYYATRWLRGATTAQSGKDYQWGTRRCRPLPNTQCAQCNAPLYRVKDQLKAYVRHFCQKQCWAKWLSANNRGSNNPSFKTGKHIDPRTGYVYIGGRLEHRIIMEQVLGRALLKSEHVHHKNRVKGDNRPENLEVISNKEHIKLYHPLETWGKRGAQCCITCGTNERPHKSKGRCSLCYERQRNRTWTNPNSERPWSDARREAFNQRKANP